MSRRAHALTQGCSVGIVAALLLAGGTVPAAAQSPPASPAPTPAPPQPPPRASVPLQRDELNRRWQFDAMMMLSDQANLISRYRQTLTFAECAQRVSPARVAHLLDQPLGSSSERRAANTLIRFAPGCLGSTMMISTRLLRGAAAEAVLGNFRTPDPDRAEKIHSARMEAFLAATPDSKRLKDETAVMLTELTQCQVLLAPGLARKVFDHSADSPEGESMREQLVASSRVCGDIEDRSQISALIHRSYLAEALYHWTRSGGKSESS